MKWLVTGDLHGSADRFKNYAGVYDDNPSEVAVIVLGDAGVNYFMNYRDHKLKKKLTKLGYNFYLIRGNHEDRPQNVPDMIEVFDEEVKNKVYMEEAWPTIKYLMDGEIYEIGGHRALVLGGAYSVDKFYRLMQGWSWFKDEQLTQDEMQAIKEKIANEKVDFVLSHTCPFSWQPIDLFLPQVDQSTVDNSMEYWMDEIKNIFTWNIWLFGHFHSDRLVRPHVEMFFHNTDELDTIWNRWNGTEKRDWWFEYDPRFYEDDNPWHISAEDDRDNIKEY